jgi:four helix bundle protein
MPIKGFKDIFAWQKAHELTLLVYKLTKKYPKDETYGLVSQSRRAAVSVPSNLAEGFKRNGKQEDSHFCNIAQASLEELQYQLLLAHDLHYITSTEFAEVDTLCQQTARLLYLWIKSKDKKH